MELTIFLHNFFFLVYSQSPQKSPLSFRWLRLFFDRNTDQIAVDLCFPFFFRFQSNSFESVAFLLHGIDLWALWYFANTLFFAFHPTRRRLFSFLFSSRDNSHALTFTHSLSVWLSFSRYFVLHSVWHNESMNRFKNEPTNFFFSIRFFTHNLPYDVHRCT